MKDRATHVFDRERPCVSRQTQDVFFTCNTGGHLRFFTMLLPNRIGKNFSLFTYNRYIPVIYLFFYQYHEKKFTKSHNFMKVHPNNRTNEKFRICYLGLNSQKIVYVSRDASDLHTIGD